MITSQILSCNSQVHCSASVGFKLWSEKFIARKMKTKIFFLLTAFGISFASGAPERDYRCPLINPEFVIHLPHEYDCTRFYKCDWGYRVLFECPDDLYFNPVMEWCDWPEESGCIPGDGSGSTTNGGDGSESTTPTEEAVDQTTPSLDTTTVNDLDPRCPVNNPEYVLHLPHEYDCTKFYKCDWGRAILFDCPAGLHFNRVLQVCDWPADAGCKAGDETTTNDGRETTTPNEGTAGTQGTTTTSDDRTTNNGLDPRCPVVNPEYVLHLPHEYDCTKFYKCDWGRAILFDCPAGLHFNRDLQVCDWPDSAGCKDGGSSTTTTVRTTPDEGTVGTIGSTTVSDGTTTDDKTTSTTESTTTRITTSQTMDPTTTTEQRTTNEVDSRCPLENSGTGLRLPHENDCTLFYICDRGQAILQSCPAGLHFNKVRQVCDWPESAGCDLVRETTTRSGLITAPTEGPVGSEGPTEEPKTTGTPPTAPTIDDRDPRCPTDNSGNTVFFPHESNCNQFYKCDWGVLVLSYCPPGLHFNSRLNVCDWPASAGCIL